LRILAILRILAFLRKIAILANFVKSAEWHVSRDIDRATMTRSCNDVVKKFFFV
jgi:hypothetical protein